jgi:FtsP/CotA-like multicopper oxidase with cupredoxin domain
MLNRREFLAVTGASAIGLALTTLPLIFHNETGDIHPLHLHRHDFEIVNIGGKASAGVMKDIVNVTRFSTANVDFVANHPGLSLFHCHMQLHMDFGFKALVKYA